MSNLLSLILQSAHGNTEWTCPYCGTQPVRKETCPTCGAARPIDFTQLPANAAATELFVLDPAHRTFLSGESARLQSSSTNSCLMLFMIPFVLAGLFLVGWTLREWYITAQIGLYGTPAQAQVARLWTESDSESGTTYHVSYRYHVQAREYTNKQQVDSESYQRLTQGERLDVLYSRTDPQVSRIPGQRYDAFLNLCVPAFTIVWNVVIFAMVSGMIVAARRDARLARQGQLIPGQVVDCQGQSDGDGGFIVTLKYLFQSPQGNPMTGQDRCNRNDLNPKGKGKRGFLPAPGTPVTVIYADDHCYRVL